MLEVLVIGAGQAGLAMGRELARQGREFLILDGARTLGQAWRDRWDSLVLFTPVGHSALPGLPFPGDPRRYPTRLEVADYLDAYARHFSLPVGLDEPVRTLEQVDGVGYLATTDHAHYRARQVVIATGPFQEPRIPSFARLLPDSVHQIPATSYRNPGQLPDGPVLVVGGGNTGVQIADELVRSRPVTLAIGSRLSRLPTRVLGRSLFDWLAWTGAMSVTVDSRMGRRARRREFLIGTGPATLARRGVRITSRAVGVTGSGVTTAGGEVVEARVVIWATGFRPHYPWLKVPVLGANGRPEHQRGVTAVPGLYFLGLPWQHTRGSALIGWVGRDAAYLAERIDTMHPSRRS
jgi:putative flavoprotein involved in K+ transport